jgi:hypothetical protein
LCSVLVPAGHRDTQPAGEQLAARFQSHAAVRTGHQRHARFDHGYRAARYTEGATPTTRLKWRPR